MYMFPFFLTRHRRGTSGTLAPPKPSAAAVASSERRETSEEGALEAMETTSISSSWETGSLYHELVILTVDFNHLK